MKRLDYFDVRKTVIAFPFLLIFLTNLLITQFLGFGYAGKLAIFASLSTFFSTILSMRWDAEILLKEKEYIGISIIQGLMSIICLTGLITSLMLIFNQISPETNLNIYLVITGALIATYELVLITILKFRKIYEYIALRCLPPIALLFLSYSGFSPETAWTFSFFLSLFPLIFVYSIHHKLINFKAISLRKFMESSKDKIAPTASALITNYISLFWLLIIAIKLGDVQAGVWINIYRITSLPVVFCGTILMPFVLLRIGSKERYTEKFDTQFKFSTLMVLASILTIGFMSLLGQEAFNFLTQSNLSIDQSIFLLVPIIAFIQYSLQYWKELFQSIDRNKSFLTLLFIELSLFGLLYFAGGSFDLEKIVTAIFSISSFCFLLFLCLVFILYRKAYDGNQSTITRDS